MIQVQPFAQLGRFQNEWLNARYHFSFGQYRDRARMGVGNLVVWNDDEIAPGTGFDPHSHKEMEIITYVRQGAITHKDSLGNEGRTEAGDVQVMHAGTGIQHAEYNRETEATRLFQIWIHPDTPGAKPGWGARSFPKSAASGLIALADGRPGADGSALPLNANAALFAGTLQTGQTITHRFGPGRVGYLVPATGAITVNGIAAGTRDGVTIAEEAEITITASVETELVLVEVRG
ncbi:MAG: pirin family protein [Acetobacteraceae bacterium]|nr:pirin family protein [Acetobacteraceae bacterium]